MLWLSRRAQFKNRRHLTINEKMRTSHGWVTRATSIVCNLYTSIRKMTLFHSRKFFSSLQAMVVTHRPNKIKKERKWSRSVVSLCDPVDCNQAPPSMGFSKQEYWSGLPCPCPGDLPNPGMEPRSPALRADTLPSEAPGKPKQDNRDVII